MTSVKSKTFFLPREEKLVQIIERFENSEFKCDFMLCRTVIQVYCNICLFITDSVFVINIK